MKNSKLLLTLAFSSVLVSCGGSNSSSDSIDIGVFNSTTVDAVCNLTKLDGTSLGAAQHTNNNGFATIALNDSSYNGVITATCQRGAYTDEATGELVDAPETLRAAVASKQGQIIVTPLSDVAWTVANNANDLANIATYTTDVADEFGLDGIDLTATTPSDLNKAAVANDNAGKFGIVLAAISQMAETVGSQTTLTAARVEANTGVVLNAILADYQNDLTIDNDHGNTTAGLSTMIETALTNLVARSESSSAAKYVSESTDAVAAIRAVDGDDGSTVTKVTGITINGNTTMTRGSTTQLSTTLTPADATFKGVNWSSNATNIANVSSSGLVTAGTTTMGNVTINAASVDGNATQNHVINVTNANPVISSVTRTPTGNVSSATANTTGVVFTITATDVDTAALNNLTLVGNASTSNSPTSTVTGIVVGSFSAGGTATLAVTTTANVATVLTVNISVNDANGGTVAHPAQTVTVE